MPRDGMVVAVFSIVGSFFDPDALCVSFQG